MTPVEVVGIFYRAMANRDKAALRSVLADNFSFKGPMMTFDGPDSFVDAMMNPPFEASITNSQFITDGMRVAHTFVWNMTAPARAEIPMCEVLTLRGSRVLHSILFFDTQQFPVG
ncbi:MAG: nuclear transport factor 2 family protein [Woeseiaceae bacterium]|nr:nuclear transport factor 2 family protein [Woeseiaceae bacterium]